MPVIKKGNAAKRRDNKCIFATYFVDMHTMVPTKDLFINERQKIFALEKKNKEIGKEGSMPFSFYS